MRSASRFGTHDFGANASRIRSLLEDIDDVGELGAGAAAAAGEEGAAAEERRQPRKASAGQAVDAVDRRLAVGLDHAARHQILQMRQHRQAGSAGQARIDADIDRAHDRRDVGRAL